MNEFAPNSVEPLILDDRIRGVPPGTTALLASAVAERNWRPADGVMALPVLTLDEAAFVHNRDLMLGYVRARGVAIAPHAKTPMSPDLARSLVEAGAWGTTVADIRQASVMLRAGLSRLILANEVGGAGGAQRLAALAAAWPEAELYVFADSVKAIAALAGVWRGRDELPKLRVLVEVGAGRAGARDLADAEAVAEATLVSDGGLVLAGVATYEGSAVQATPEETDAAIAALFALTASTLRCVRARVESDRQLVVTGGGSAFFDRAIAELQPAIVADGRAILVIRSGAIFLYDHGLYDRALAALDARGGFRPGDSVVSARRAFRPALRVWAEVLSRPETGLAICGMGLRDVSSDQGLPIVLRVHRDGRPLPAVAGGRVVKLNDQHAFLALEPGDDVRVGDVIEFGISHPCTCLDRYRVIFGLDESGRVRHAFPTYFG
jgi:D-serine dehydratase